MNAESRSDQYAIRTPQLVSGRKLAPLNHKKQHDGYTKAPG